MPPAADTSTANVSYKALAYEEFRTLASSPPAGGLVGSVCRTLYPEFTNADKGKHTPLATPRGRVTQYRHLRSLAPIATRPRSMPMISART